MIRTLALLCAAAMGLIFIPTAALAQAPAAATPENAASFIGDWTLSLEGGQGPAQIPLSIKADAGKVVGSLSMGGQGTQTITDVSVNGKTLMLTYSFDYQGNAVEAVVSLTLAGDKVNAQISFAGGAYTMSGTAEKKK